ncbi:hypothetical protein KTT_04270 [Tengunoibacter tsumagoiensis]|uniref:Uncharacterized protein n=1 Tax=Tengunoibacter tsumagoiensis TaxID=2014871 RepID=A0A401ZUD7_9CHLR|nr:hypothetical protein KTT_04270 [Tengunoibacter tsumagoiensis]
MQPPIPIAIIATKDKAVAPMSTTAIPHNPTIVAAIINEARDRCNPATNPPSSAPIPKLDHRMPRRTGPDIPICAPRNREYRGSATTIGPYKM